MPKHWRHSGQGRGKYPPRWPYWPPAKHPTPSFIRRETARVTLGTPYDRDPCPHTLVSWVEVPDPTRPGRMLDRKVYTPCQRPGGHVRESKLISVPDIDHQPYDPKRFTTMTVPDTEARKHADAAGRTWG